MRKNRWRKAERRVNGKKKEKSKNRGESVKNRKLKENKEKQGKSKERGREERRERVWPKSRARVFDYFYFKYL